MTARRTTAALFAAAVAVAGYAATAGPADAATLDTTVNYVVDGGFDATTVAADGSGASTVWESFDSSYQASALCTTAVGSWCSPSPELANEPAHGAGWVWFGYTPEAHATGYAKQTFEVPVDGAVTLSYNYRNGSSDFPYDATLEVKVDGKVVQEHVEAPAGALSGYQTYYATLDLAAGSHELSFEYDNGSGAAWDDAATYNNVTIDDVAVTPYE